MLNRIYVNNALSLQNFDMSFTSTHSVINNDKNNVIKILVNIYNGSNDNEIIDSNSNGEIKLFFQLNNKQIDYISSYIVLDSSYLVVFKLIGTDTTKYYINEKEVNFSVVKRILNYLIDNRRIVSSLYNDANTVIENYVLKHDEQYSMNKYNYLKMNSLKNEYENELKIIEDNKGDENIQDLINIKNEIESFDLEKGEITYITNKYNAINKENASNTNYSKVIDSFSEALDIMKENMTSLEELEKEESIVKEVSSLEDSFFNLKESFDNLKNTKFNNKDENNEYIIERYNNIQEFKQKYGNTYHEINEYYQNVISKINYYKYSKINKRNIEDKITTIDKQLNKITKVLNSIRNDYVYNIVHYFNEICSRFDEDVTIDASLNEELKIFVNIENNPVSLDELKEYHNYNLITFLLNTIFLLDNDKTIIVDDDFSNEFDKEKMYIFIKLLNQFNNCLVLSSNELLA